MAIDYANLKLVDALDLAVLIEEEAKERYEELTAQMEVHHTPEAARFFAQMARNEEKHRAELDERRKKLFPTDAKTVRREMLFDVEAPEYSEVRMYMTPRQALGVALKSEEKAYTFFTNLLATVKDVEVKKLFEELQGEEQHHQALVKAEIEKLPPDDGFRQEDFEDEPNSPD